MAAIPVVLAGGALLAWMLLRPPPVIAFDEFSARLDRGEVAAVQVMEDALQVEVEGADGRSGTYRVSLAGLGVQSLLNYIDRRGIPIEAEGEGTVRVRTFTTGSGEALPGALLSLGSQDGAGCDPCDPSAGHVLAAGGYGVRPTDLQWMLDSIQVGAADGSLERLAPGSKLFVRSGSTLDVVASLSSTLPVDPGVPPSATLRITTQGLPANARFSLDGQPLTRTDSVSLVPGQTHRVVAEAQNRVPDTLVIMAQVGDTSWTPRLPNLPTAAIPRPGPPDPTPPSPSRAWSDTFASPEAAIQGFLRALESGMDGVEGVWSGASTSELQPWRAFLQDKTVRTASIIGSPTQIRFGEFDVLVNFTISSPPNDPGQRSLPQPLRFVLSLDGTQWRISQVINRASSPVER